ncbi:hypothetical protein Q7C18_02655 [Nesterenkonia sp. CL21]|uniref:hypothetical protein n=1 Tax=Nesterenkonia sp. CL21 TaxID=3064894 RepID=UPI00287AA4B9|nr:hypothetical protein [Nesterenkonia sp. CL21]MDS2171589.1 hypothetical protein [Nesterenkonia sp. CL21]
MIVLSFAVLAGLAAAFVGFMLWAVGEGIVFSDTVSDAGILTIIGGAMLAGTALLGMAGAFILATF